MHKLDIHNKRSALIVEEFERQYPRLMNDIVRSTMLQPLQRWYIAEIEKRHPAIARIIEIETRPQLEQWKKTGSTGYLGGVL